MGTMHPHAVLSGPCNSIVECPINEWLITFPTDGKFYLLDGDKIAALVRCNILASLILTSFDDLILSIYSGTPS